MTKINKLAMACILATASLGAQLSHAQGQVGDPYEHRKAIVSKYSSKKLTLGIFPGTVQGTDGFTLLSRYLPLTNLLSESTAAVVSFVPLRSKDDVVAAAKDRIYDFIYTNAETAVTATKEGFVPIARRNDPIQGAWVVKDASITGVEDLSGKKIGLVDKAMVSTLSKYELIEKKLTDKVTHVDIPSGGQDALVVALKEGIVDAILVRKTVADKLVKDGYKVVGTTKEVPGFLLMMNKTRGGAMEVGQSMAKGFLDLSPQNDTHARVLSGFDVGQDQGTPFVPAGAGDLDLMTKVLETVATAKFKTETLGKK